MSLEKQVMQAVARGWCHPENAGKEVDVDLAKAITAEVVGSFTPKQKRVCDTCAGVDECAPDCDQRRFDNPID